MRGRRKKDLEKKLKFGHLHLHTLYSSLDSIVKLDELVEACKKRNIMAVAMTDHGNVDGAYNFYKACKEGGVKPILGCELYFVDNLHARPNFVQKSVKVDVFKVFLDNHLVIEGERGEGVFIQTGKKKKKVVFRKYEKLKQGDLIFILPGDVKGQVSAASNEGEVSVAILSSVEGTETLTYNKVVNTKRREKEKKLHVVVLAKNWKGFQKIMRLLTIANMEGFYYKPRIDQKTLFEVCDSDVVVMTACTSGFLSGSGYLKRVRDFSEKYGDDFYLEMMPLDYQQQHVVNARAIALNARGFGKLVMTNDVHYLNKEDAKTQEVVLAIAQKAKMKWPTEIKDVIKPVSGGGKSALIKHTKVKTRWKFDVESLYLMSPREMIEAAISVGIGKSIIMECIESIDEIINKCNIDMGKISPTLPLPYPDVEDEVQLFKDKVIVGAKQRGFDLKDEEIRSRIDKEVKAIIDGGFVRYFLIVEDLIVWAKRYMVVGPGRGSVGGCFIAYCLGITEVNPLRWGMIFERFISEGRIDLPDIDMDFQDDKRFMVLKYLENKYGKDCVANVANYSKLKGKSALRDVCRVFDVPGPVVSRTAEIIQTRSTGDARAEYSLMDSLETFEEGKKFKRAYPIVAKHAIKVEGIIRHGGCHAAGVVVNSTSLLLGEQCVIVRRSKYDRVINWDKKALEFFGLCKLDILGLKTLSVIGETEDRVGAVNKDRIELSEPEGTVLDVIGEVQDRVGLSGEVIHKWMHELNDERVFKLLRDGHTAGIFQFNTYGMKDFVIKMDISSFKDMYDTSALFRPGTLRTGLAMEYIKRKKGTEDPVYFHPIYEEITKTTQGIMLYQEQIMFLLYRLAGIGWRTCDMVRKAISKSQGVEVIRKFKSLFVDGCVKRKTLSAKVAGGLFDKIEVFGSYAFNLSHAVEYTVISYVTAMLKIEYPIEFLCAGLNHTSDEKRDDLIREAKRLNVEITYPDINLSEGGWSIADGKLVCGLREIANVGPKAVEEILNAREAGPFKDAEDFHNRINRRVVNKRVVESIVTCNAFFNEGENPIDIAESMFKFSLLYDEAAMYKQYISVVPEVVRKKVRYITLADLAKASLADDGVDLSKVDGIEHFEKPFLVFGKVRDLRYSFTDFKDRENFSKDGYWQHLAYLHFTDGDIYTHISLTKQLYYAKKEFSESLKDKWVFVEIVRFYDSKTGNYFNMSSDVWDAADVFSCDPTAKSRLDKFQLTIRRRLGDEEREKLAKLGEENFSCPMLKECMYARKPVPLDVGKTNILIVVEAPGRDETASGKPLVGQAGVEFWKVMAKYGMKSRCSFCISNVLKCQPENNKITREAPVKKCAKAWLEKEIGIIRPSVIFSLGNTPKKFFGREKGITELAGTVEWSPKYKCFIVYGIHPAAVLYHDEYMPVLEKSVKAFKVMISKV